MKILTALSFLMMLPALAFCAPYLTCDCSPAGDLVTGASLQFNSGAWADTPVVNSCSDIVCATGSKTFCYDLSTLPNGAHTVAAKFKNIWGESVPSLPFNFVKGGPSISPIIKIKP